MRFLKRFPEEKHDQIKQLMSYIELCGVTGKDLVSIGGYIDRSRKAAQSKIWAERVKSYNIEPVGKDGPRNVYERFRIKNADGTGYTFVNDGWTDRWTILSNKTLVKKSYQASSREWPSSYSYGKQQLYDMVLDINDGLFKLDF